MSKTLKCEACGASENTSGKDLVIKTTHGTDVAYVSCSSCGTMRVDPMPSVAELASFYDDAYYGLQKAKFVGLIELLRGVCLNRRANRVLPLVDGTPIRILDIGAGDGRFLKRMHAQGCDCVGIELEGPTFDRSSRCNGVRIISGDVTDAGFESASLDAITIWHVLDHITTPLETVRCCFEKLREGGLLVVEVPNLGSWQGILTGDKYFHLDPPRHVYQFTHAALHALLTRVGFDIIKQETGSLEMGVLGAAQSWMNGLIKPRDLFYDMLRTKNRCHGRRAAKCASIVLAALLMPFALVFTVAEAAFGHGPVLRFFCRKPTSPDSDQDNESLGRPFVRFKH
jgi:2-polyprenyl-3-methyl-5-hydroxy-6-metoxy-1,4-benzoquinol methylase